MSAQNIRQMQKQLTFHRRVFHAAISLVVFGLFWTAGCTQIPHVLLWNNSGHEVVIDADHVMYHCPANSRVSLKFPGNTMRLQVIRGTNNVWRYSIRYPDEHFMRNNKIFAQLESDGAIYVLCNNKAAVTEQLPEQPRGFPLRPN